MSIIRDHLNVDLQASLYDYVLNDRQAITSLGISASGDSELKFYYWDSASTDTDDGENVIKPTAIMGGTPGRWIKHQYTQYKADWNQSDSDALDYIKNKPTITNVLPGVLLDYAGTSAPTGYLLCDGSAVSRTTYSDLFTICGTTYGSGNGSTTFNLPDCRQRVTITKGDSGTASALGETGGSIDHVHTIDPPNTTTGTPSGTSGQLVGVINVASATHTHDLNIPQFDSGSNNQKYITLNKIIKY